VSGGERGLIIAIDGPSGSGKSTTARLLARRLDYLYIDTGAMYRAVTVKVLREAVNPEDGDAVAEIAEGCDIRLEAAGDGLRVLLDGEDVSDEIRTPEVTRHVSTVSEVPHVREVLVEAQRVMGEEGGVVLEGRDIGTVVFPGADLKIFMEAELRIRAERRCAELAERGIEVSAEDVANDMLRRDEHDSGRFHSPLRRAEDAVVVDTSGLTIAGQVDVIEALARERMR
jgi:cytidylate kinase